MQGNFPTTEELGLDFPEGEYYEVGGAGGELPSFESDLAALDVPEDRSGEGGNTPPSTTDTPPPAGDAAEVEFDKPAPIADWKQKADGLGFSEISSEEEFRDQLELNRFVQAQFYADKELVEAYHLLTKPDVTERELLEYNIRAKLEEGEDETDVEEKLGKYIDEDGVVNEKGKRVAEMTRRTIDGRIGQEVTRLETEARAELAEQKAFHTTLQSSIKALPAERYTAAEKTELHRYITSGQYFRDAVQRDDNGNMLLKGGDLAGKLLENAERLHPAFAEKRLNALYQDAKALGVTEFLKKYKN